MPRSLIRESNKDNLSLILYKAGDMRLEQAPLPDKLGPNQVLLQTQRVGICGSDVHYWIEGRIGKFVVKEPMILGHETSAKVAEIGENVKNLKIGDRVAVEPGVPCGTCDECKQGIYNLCPNIFFSATPPDNGTLTRYFKHSAAFCYKLPDNVSYEEGAMCEPLSVAIHGCTRACIKEGDKVLVCGAGPIGLTCILVARVFGATDICVTDINNDRLKVARKIGADKIVLLSSGMSEHEEVKVIESVIGCKPNVVLECSGTENSVRVALTVCKSAGTIVLIGMGPEEIKVPLLGACIREVDIRGVFRYRHTYNQAISLIASGKIDVKPIITHRFKLEEAYQAFEAAKSGKAVKCIIDCSLSTDKVRSLLKIVKSQTQVSKSKTG